VNVRSQISRRQFALLAALGVFIVGARWAVIAHFGSDLPFWDQWDAEGTRLLSPWLQHRYTLAMLVDHHNEHRVVLSRLWALGLTLANGQWDQRLECVVNAFLPAAVALGFLTLAFRHLNPRWYGGLVLLLMAIFGLPVAWENILRGFDSQQYFLISLSFGAIVWLPTAEPGSRRFWLGSACVIAALGSMATGFFASVVVGGMLLVRWGKREVSLRQSWPGLTVCAFVMGVGALTHVTVPYHAIYLARSFEDFSLSVRHSLQWPGYGPTWSWMAVVMWLPWTWLTVKVLRQREAVDQPLGTTLAGLGGWVILQIFATAYARGAGGPDPASRYEDTLVFGAAVNALAIAWLWQNGQLRGIARDILAVTGIAWVLTFGLTTYQNCVPIFRVNNFYCEQNTRNYLATGDEAYVRHDEIPYPGSAAYLDHLHAPGLIPLLPASVRTPLALARGQGDSTYIKASTVAPENLARGGAAGQLPHPSGFSPSTPPLTNRVTWGSYGASGAAGVGDWASRPLRAQAGWLKFELAGQPGTSGISLELRDAGTGKIIAEVRPDRTPGNTWRSAYVRAPAHPFILFAQDHSAKGWLAFTAPVKMGPLSYASWRWAKHGLLLAELSGVAAILLGWIESRRRRRV
jgi:hypothetical protein